MAKSKWEMDHPADRRIKDGQGCGPAPTTYKIDRIESGHIVQTTNGYWLSLNIEHIQALEEAWGRGTYISGWTYRAHPWQDLCFQVVSEEKQSKDGRTFRLVRVKGQALPNGPQHATGPSQSAFSGDVANPFAAPADDEFADVAF